MIHMPHFRRLAEVIACVKQILAFFHGGYLWLGIEISITLDLISHITGLHKVGVDPSHYFQGKDNDKNLLSKLGNMSQLHHVLAPSIHHKSYIRPHVHEVHQ